MKSRAKSRPKVSVAQQEIEHEDNPEDVFKHYDNKFFDMDSLPGGQTQCTIPVPNMEIQELQEYVAKCYGDLYREFNDFKSSTSSQLLSLQEEVQALSFHNSSRNDGVFPESLKDSSSQNRLDSSEGRAADYPAWSNKAQVEYYEEHEKQAAQFHHKARQHFRPESTSPLADEPSPRLDKHPPYRPTADEEELIQHVPADTWSNFTSHMAESSLSRGTFSQADTQFSNATERKQDSNTYLSRKLQGYNPPNTVPEFHKSTNRGSKIRSGWSSRERNESLPSSTATAWQEETCAQSNEYEDAEEEHEQAIEKMVSEYNDHKIKSSNGVHAKDQVFTNVHVKPSVGRDRFALKGWAASFLQQPADSQLPKAVNKQYIKQEAYKYNNKERASELVSSGDIRGGELRMDQPVQQQPVEIDIPNKRPSVTLAKDSLSRSNSQEARHTKNFNMNLNSTKPTSDLHEKRQPQVSNQQKLDAKFSAKKNRGGIAWNVDELAVRGR